MKIIAIALTLIMLSGCVKDRFDCPYTAGASCANMTQIDHHIKAGEQNTKAKSKTSLCGDTESDDKKSLVIETVKPHPAGRTQEVVMQMWIAPYESTDGIFYQASFVNVIVKKSEWENSVGMDVTEGSSFNG